MSTPKKLSFRIKAIQKALGKTQQQFAVDLETHQPTLSFIYSGEREAPGRMLMLLITKLNVNPSYLALTSDKMFAIEKEDKRKLITDIRSIGARLDLIEEQIKFIISRFGDK